jgi:tetratricopeptide (TPR) repeat protein
MPGRKTIRPSPARASSPAGAEAILVPLGLLAALVLPFFVWLADSPEQLRDSKLVLQAAGATIALLGLALEAYRRQRPFPGFRDLPGAGQAAVSALAGVLVLALASAVANSARVDPLTAAAVLSPLALAAVGASDTGTAAAPRVFGGLMLAGAVSGLLAAAQRFLGVLRIIPMEAPEPRFLAAGLVGNPGDLAAALLFPAVLLWIRMTGERPQRGRLFAAAGFTACLVGLGATESMAPLAALAAGVFVHFLLDVRARWRPFAAAILLFAIATGVTGAGPRALQKLGELRRGRIGAATTQRDIGVLAAVEMIRARPLLGVGPGAFSNAFVPARLRAEERVGRHLVHRSGFAHFENAHSEPLTLAAENGLPAALLSLVAVAALGAGLLRLHREKTAAARPPATSADTLNVLLVSFAVLSLASFPLRLPLAVGPAAFAFGLALRALAHSPRGDARPSPRLATLLILMAVLTAGTAGIRIAAVSLQADGELRLRATHAFEGAARSDMNDSARRQLKRALSLRPMSASGWIALGSTYRIDHDWENAFLAYTRSLSIEERAETDFNLGLVVLNGSAPEKAVAFFRRALWILPRLSDSLPPAVDADALTRANRETAATLGSGARPPGLPDGLTPRI